MQLRIYGRGLQAKGLKGEASRVEGSGCRVQGLGHGFC